MKKLFLGLLLLVGAASAQEMTSENLIGSYNLSGTVTTNSYGGGFSGGNVPGYNPTSNTILFGYTQSTAAYTYAVSQALRDSGLVLTGYNYSWEYLNHGESRGTLSADVSFIGINGATLYSRNWSLGSSGANWQTVTGTETFTSSILTSNLANLTLSFTGRDDRFWAGYYGPQVRNPSLSVNYTFDQCATNPLSSPTCAGYAEAYQTQQCTANTLYSPSCPGYAAAYLTYQCSVDPLYSTTCAGYSEAYAKKNILTQDKTKDSTTILLAQTDPTSQIVPLVSDPVVNRAITTTGTTANSEANPAAPVKLNSPAGSSSNNTQEVSTGKKTNTAKPTESASSNKTKTTRQALVEKQREKAKAEAVARGKDLANTMGKAADMAAQVEVQNVVIQAMGFTPGFDSYSRLLPDGQFYRPYEAYPNQKNVDTVSGRRLFGGSDSTHQQMIDSQYNLGK
jgi:hypothetical protein